MVFAYLAVGLVLGSVAALLAVLAGYSVWHALGVYVLAGNLGLLVAVLYVALRRPSTRPQDSSANERADPHRSGP